MSAPISKYYSIKYEKEIGKGVSGCVYQAIKKSDGLLSAVKIITRSKLSKDAVTAIANEVQALRSLNHPHIVRLYDMFEDRSHFYLAMEFIQGGELFDRISKKTCYNELEAKTCCRIILSAVKHCHDNNIVHRDLKPENLLLEGMNDDTNIKLVDFGFAASAPDNTLTGILGTPIYMAPEIWSNQPYGKPVDMWAFGVITYILLGGYPPFSDERREKLVQRIRLAKFAFHNEFWSQISQEAKDFITALLNPDFSTRLTVDQAAQHPWLREDPNELAGHTLDSTVENLKEFNAKRKLKTAIHAVHAVSIMKKLWKINIEELSEKVNVEPAVDDTVLVHLARQSTIHAFSGMTSSGEEVIPGSEIPEFTDEAELSSYRRQLEHSKDHLEEDIRNFQTTLDNMLACPPPEDVNTPENQILKVEYQEVTAKLQREISKKQLALELIVGTLSKCNAIVV